MVIYVMLVTMLNQNVSTRSHFDTLQRDKGTEVYNIFEQIFIIYILLAKFGVLQLLRCFWSTFACLYYVMLMIFCLALVWRPCEQNRMSF